MMLAKMSMGKKREKKGNEKKKAIKTRMSSSKNQTAPHRTNAKKKIKKLSVSGLLLYVGLDWANQRIFFFN